MNIQNDQSEYVRKDLKKLLILIGCIVIVFSIVEYYNTKTTIIQDFIDNLHLTTLN